MGCPDCAGDRNQALYRVTPDGVKPVVFKCLNHARVQHPEVLTNLLKTRDDNRYHIEHHFVVLAENPSAAATEARRVLREHGFTDPTFFVKARPE